MGFQLSVGFTIGVSILGKSFGFSIQLQGRVQLEQKQMPALDDQGKLQCDESQATGRSTVWNGDDNVVVEGSCQKSKNIPVKRQFSRWVSTMQRHL